MKRVVLLTMCIAVASLCLQASPVAIANAGFEANVLAQGAFTFDSFSGDTWICVMNSSWGAGSCGAQHMGSTQWTGGDTGIPDPVNTAYSNGGTISQVLSTALANNTLYTLTVFVGKRLDNTNFPGYDVELVAGSNIIAHGSTVNPVPGGFLVSTAIYQSLAADPNVGSLLGIRLVGNLGAQTNFDKVALDAAASVVPEPGTAAFSLIGLALICVPRLRAVLARR